MLLVVCVTLGLAVAQTKPPQEAPVGEGSVQREAVEQGVGKVGVGKQGVGKIGASARAAIRKARAMLVASGEETAAERSRRLELAARALDQLVADFADEPAAAAMAAWHAAETWRRHGSPPLAEKGYLRAARLNAPRYGQRGLLRAADMQRRQQRVADATKTYRRAEAADPRTAYAQDARVWVARMLLANQQVEQAIARLQAALESAPSPSMAIETADHLAKAWIVKGDLESAGFVIDHARQLAADASGDDPVMAERLDRAYTRMRAHRALQRARDDKFGAKQDAVRLDAHRKRSASRRAGGSRPRPKTSKSSK